MHSLAQVLPVLAARYGEKPALVTQRRTLTFVDLDRLSNAVANNLLAHGLRRGDVVSIFSQNRWEWVVAYHGILKAGGVVNPVNVMLTIPELVYVLNDCSAKFVFIGEDQAQRALAAVERLSRSASVVCFDGPARPGLTQFETYLTGSATLAPSELAGPNEVCTVGYTSGTTGHPKGALQSHQAVYLNNVLVATMHGRNERDIVVSPLPAAHVYGNFAINGTLLAGGTVVLMERFDASMALTFIEKHRATMFEGVPTMYAAMIADPAFRRATLSSITRSTVGGQLVFPEILDAWEEATDAQLLNVWGMTELSGAGTTHPYCGERIADSVGVSLPGVSVRIAQLGDVTQDAPIGVPGELMVRGPIVMLGYLNNQEATTKAIEPDGWLHTGDVAYMDSTGHVFIVDRRSDMLITAGYNVYPAEIERVLSAHADVSMVAVGPIPDPTKGELACAYIVLKEGCKPDPDALLAYAREQLAAYKVPRVIRFVDALPTTSSGKIMRRKLIELVDKM